ncbi:MAG TPA: Rho termination factor N-terminal domain-containing protein [Solirubrobacteraceae bacterium]|jgi:transcription termination factor Rho|nr:Rho termination factor N-terminal domain-containing protein [Solirubrobacteraceae bacterium]
MSVFDRSELQASPLADLHAIADQLGLEGFRRLRKADLIDAILGEPAAKGSSGGSTDGATADAGEPVEDQDADVPSGEKPRRRPSVRGRRSRRGAAKDADAQDAEEKPPAQERPIEDEQADGGDLIDGSGPGSRRRGPAGENRPPRGDRPPRGERPSRGRGARGERSPREDAPVDEDRVAEGVVELLGNGSAFLRVHPPEASDEDVYISAAQVRRCELVTGDRVTGPLRTPRRSERYSSLIRVETINGAPAGEVSEGARYDERPVAYPSERLALDGGDATLEAVEWLTPFGRGSRVLITGPARAGKTEILRRLLGALSGRENLEATLLLVGVRPEEVAEWAEGPVAPATTLSFAASADAQGQAVERAIETAKRTAARGGDALVLIDTLDGLHPHAARKVLAAARNLTDGGSLTILATATRPYGGETTVIALDPSLADAGGPPLDLTASGTVRAELLVGEEGAAAIAKARASALDSSG